MTYELVGLDAVDWKALDDAYGHAGAVPTFLQSLASRDERQREWALEALFAGINHQGSTYSASIAALPFLTMLVLEPSVPDREAILQLLVGLATGEPEWALLHQEFETLCLRPLGDESARFLGLLAAEDHGVRSRVIHLLGHLESGRNVILPALGAAFEREADPYLRASLVMAMARVSRGGELSSEERALVSRARDLSASESLLGRAVAAMCSFYLDGRLTEAERSLLQELDRSGLRVQPSYPWNGGKVGNHAREILKAMMPVEEALAALERGEWDCQKRARALLFTPQEERPIRLLLPEEMSENQMRYLRSAVTRDQAYYDAFWRETGLPHTETWLKRFVGALPRGALDHRVRVRDGEWPLWNVLHAVLNELLPLEEWVRVADAMSDEQLLLVYDDATSRDLQLDKIREHIDRLDPQSVERCNAYRDRLHRLVLDRVVTRPALVSKFEERADALLSRPLENASYLERTLLFAGLGLAAEAANRELDARFLGLARPGDWSPAMTHVEPLRWGLGRLPLALRWKWFEGMRLVSLTRLEDARGVRHKVRVHDGWQFLDLVPTREAQEALKEAIFTIEQHREGTVTESMELGLTRGPLITWAKDDELPVAALARIRESWGKLWQELYPA